MTTASNVTAAQSVRTFDALDPRALEIVQRRRARGLSKRRGWLVRRMLAIADVVGLAAAFALAQLLFGDTRPVDQIDPVTEYLLFAATLPVWIVIAKLYGLYDLDEERTDHSTTDDVVPVMHMITVGTWLFFVFSYLGGFADPNVPKLGTFWFLGIVLVSVARAGSRAFCRRQLAYLQNTIIVGAGDVGQIVAHKLLQHPEYGINLVGFVDAAPRAPRAGIEHVALLGPPDELSTLIELLDVERVIFAFSQDSHDDVLALIRDIKAHDVQIDIVPRLFEILSPTVGIHTVEGLPLLGLPPLQLSRSSKLLKRTIDVVLAGAAVAVLTPLLVAIALLIKRDSPGPVFFRQTRMGSGDRPFEILKFRTMTADAEERKAELTHLNIHARSGDTRMFKLADDPRTTRVGRVLRRYSLDELPQLFNVLRGEMSLVGPRPLILSEDRHIQSDWARQRLSLKPGMTGPWQVLGASEIPFEEMVKIDYVYVTTWSVLTDLKLVFRTVPALLRERSAY